MATFDISKIKITWKGQWHVETKYYKNDIVQWQDRTYRCILDTPDRFVTSFDAFVDTSQYQADQPFVKRVTIRPDNTNFFTLFMPSNSRELWTWEMWRRYEPGDMVKSAGAVYMCTKRTRRSNTWVEETDYWTKILETASGADKRNEIVSYANRAPLGWKYNMGEGNVNAESNYAAGFAICSDGNYRHEGDYMPTAKGGKYARNGSSHFALGGFTMTGWLNSTDNASWNSNATGRLTTPDGKAPRVMQITSAWNTAAVLMNNGEIYMSGYNGHGQLGNSNTSNRRHWIRAAADDTVDWEGNPMEYSFNDTKMVKITTGTQTGTAGSNAFCALDEHGYLWLWGYNGNGNLGFTQSTPTNSNNYTSPSIGFSHYGNFTRPVRMPKRYFDGKRIVDVYGCGGGSGSNWHAIDEDGCLWGWGNTNNGGLGIGGNSDDQYNNQPMKVLMDWTKHGGIKKIQHVSADNSQLQTIILTNDGILWGAGYDYYGWINGNRGTGGNTTYHSRFRRLTGEMWQGRVDNFWFVGDQEKGLYWTFKDDWAVYGVSGSPYYRLSSNSDNTYNITSGQGYKMPGHWVLGPRGAKHITTTSNGNYSSTTQTSYWGTLILDENNDIWVNGYNNHGQLGGNNGGNPPSSNGWQNDYNSPLYNLGDEYNGYSRMKRVWEPAGMTFTDVHGSGYTQYGYTMARDHKGRPYITGSSGVSNSGYESGQYNIWANEYYRTTGSNPGSYHAYQFHGAGPSD